jgi:VWA domain-containing protein
MANSLAETATVPQRFLPAWLFSIVFHSSMMVLLGVAVQQAPRGAAEEPGRSAGIVLKRTSAEGDLYDGEEQHDDQPATSVNVTAPELLPSLPSATADADPNNDLPMPTTLGPSATVGEGQPDARQFTSGGGRRGSPDGRGDARVSVFGVQGTGSKFVYVFDRSSSMEGPPLAAAKRQLIESLQSLESVHQLHIIFFNTRTRSLEIAEGGRRIAFATDRNKQLAANFVGGITADGGTDRLGALREAIGFSPDVIFFLTDADDPMSASELAEIARTNRRSRAAICVIEFGRRAAPPGSNFLTELARESGGQYGYVNAAALSR